MKNKIVIFLLLVCLCVCGFCGCKSSTDTNTVSAKNISLCLETIKDWYTVGDNFYYDGAQINVVYSDNTTARVDITASMIIGFDTSKVGDNLTCSVEYGGASTTLTYDVVAVGSIGSSDVTMDVTYTNNSGTTTATITPTNLASEDAGIYAISFEISLTSATIGSISYASPDEFTVVIKEIDGVAYVLAYATNGNSTLNEGEFTIYVVVEMESDSATIKVDNGVISDKLCDKSITMNRINIVSQ